jgi:hypothetical protein
MKGNKFVVGLLIGIVILIILFFGGFMALYYNVFKKW